MVELLIKSLITFLKLSGVLFLVQQHFIRYKFDELFVQIGSNSTVFGTVSYFWLSLDFFDFDYLFENGYVKVIVKTLTDNNQPILEPLLMKEEGDIS